MNNIAREEAIRVIDELRLHSQDSRTKNDGIRIDALIGLGWGPVVPVPTREQIELAVYQALMPEMMSLSLAIGSQEHYNELLARISDHVLALFSPVEGNTK